MGVNDVGLPVELAVLIPTLNERENIAALVDRLGTTLADIRWEAVFVDDDSPDGTADLRESGAGSFPLALRGSHVLRSQRIQPLDRIRRKPWLNRKRRPLASRFATSFQA